MTRHTKAERNLLVTLLLAALVALAGCAGGHISVGSGYRSMDWYGYYGRGPFWRCCGSRPIIVVPPDSGGPEPELPIEPTPPLEAIPLPSGGFGGDFGGDFGGGDMGGDFGAW